MPAEQNNAQTFSFETVAVLVAILKERSGTLGMKDYELMASLDGTRTASGFDHMFRKVKSRATELLDAKNKGALPATPVKKPAARAKSATPATGKSASEKKRGKASWQVFLRSVLLTFLTGAKTDKDADDDDDEPASKKVKKGRVEDSVLGDSEDGYGVGDLDDMF